ncbi:MAG: NlpC/P60 family protein [Firmicutes bacterium]|nr:NlpC/P60 family protein [Bacillota bacterium]
MVVKDHQKKINKLIKKFEKAKFVHNGRSLEEGIDCLGFLILFYKEFGINIPSNDGKPIDKYWFKEDPERYIRAIKSLGEKEVSFDELQPLDMAYFVVTKNIITHTGIMIDNQRFVHMSPKRGLLISKLKRHWKRRFRGAIRFVELDK